MEAPKKEMNCGKLRAYASRGWLRLLVEPVLVVSGLEKEPLAVLVPYHQWQKMGEK